jgi:hypothetical protein
MKNLSIRVLALACLSAMSIAAGCGGGSSGAGGSDPSSTPSTNATTAGVYKGTITSTATGQSTQVVALVGANGQTTWMSTDGRVWDGTMPMTGAQFDASLMGHMYTGSTFPDGSHAGMWTMNVDHSSGQMSGHFAGSGDAGHFSLMLNSMWNRPASLQTLAGVYTRSTWSGYANTMTIGTDGQLVAADSRGCNIDGTVTVPDPTRNMYAISATVTSCGTLDGAYQGMGTLLDATAMRDWMTAMHPLEQGGHTHGSMGGMGGMGGMTYNTIPSGTSNLFMFVLRNDQNAMMDALAK